MEQIKKFTEDLHKLRFVSQSGGKNAKASTSKEEPKSEPEIDEEVDDMDNDYSDDVLPF